MQIEKCILSTKVQIKVIKLYQIKKVNNIQVQACYRKGSKKQQINHLIHLGKINNNPIKDLLSTFPNPPPLPLSTFMEITNQNLFLSCLIYAKFH